MFYSQFILAKKGPLGTIWIAAHLERKLRKNQVADTDIGVSVDSILSPEAPIALRMSSHLLLGVVRIYNRKVNYLFDDCSEALLNVKQAFRSTAVDLPPEESKAPYHSITLPEKFDLDDFELPDSDIFKGNYVDHHISSREQITLQDSMEGVSYSTSKFGLDERFGDGDASGLDLDEELFLNRLETAGAADESAEPQTSYRAMTSLKPEEPPEDVVTNSETMFGAADELADVMDYAQAPSTPGLVEEPNLSNAKNASACEDHMESEYHVMESNMKENDKQEVDWCSRDDMISNVVPVPQGQHEENAPVSSVFEIKESETHKEFPTEGQDEDTTPTSELTSRIEASQEDLSTEAFKEEKAHFLSVDETCNNYQGPNGVMEKRVVETSGLANIDQHVSEGVLVKDKQKSCDVDGSYIASGIQVGSFIEIPETQARQEIPLSSNLEAHDKEVASMTLVSGPCNSLVENPDLTKPRDRLETDADVMSDISLLETNEREGTTMPGKVFCTISNSDQILKENRVQEHASGEDIHVPIINGPAAQVHNTNSQDTLDKNLNSIREPELPAPEKLLSVPEGVIDSVRDMLLDVSPSEFEGFDVAGSKSAAGRKRSFTESTLTEHSLNSVESSRQVRVKRATESLPDDDDLLSSILAGRNSSVLKVKPTPPLAEVTSMKRTRAVTRSGAPKRKVIVDDTMVLHGDMIRHQLTNTEDIRRVRKKAPCTLAEISALQKQHREDEIFLGTIFTGMSVELASLHTRPYDLNLITVCKDDVHLPSLDTVTGSQDNKNDASFETVIESNLASIPSLDTLTETRLLSQEGKNVASLETIVEPNLASMDDNYAASLETMAVSYLTSPHNENHNVDPGQINVTKINVQVGSDVENPLLSENRLEEVNYTSIDTDFSREEQTKPTNDAVDNDSRQEPLVGAAKVGISLINAVTENLSVIPEIDPLDLVPTASLNELSESSHMNMDASACAVPDQMMSIHSLELDYFVDVGGGQEIDKCEVAEKGDGENEAVERVNKLPDMVQDAAGTNHGESENNLENETYNINPFEEHIGLEFSHGTLGSRMEDSLVNNGENLNQSEVYKPNMTDAAVSGFDLPDRDDMNYLAVGTDTEFLNVDDDELTEIADDHMPDDEETQYTDNSGWSSRTRAVSKYLQAAFVKEAESGNKSLSMDYLLTGKTRKEASRMFFETLVLKTRDYIHVEQPNPYDDITIKPRSNLMKSDF